jgi:hypothetical protein
MGEEHPPAAVSREAELIQRQTLGAVSLLKILLVNLPLVTDNLSRTIERGEGRRR